MTGILRGVSVMGNFALPLIGKPFRGGLVCILAWVVFQGLVAPQVGAQESTDESMAAYADAANFQTNGAIPLAIEAWHKFLKEYPKDPMASKAAHFLGVCYMQRENPDYVAATKAFAIALKDKEYDLREESLANQGWCFYASAGEGQQRDAQKLKESLATFETLRKEKPESRYLDRAHFYSGEAAYGLGQAKEAIAHYDRLLALPNAKESPLRCDAFYARGVAYEELKEWDKAVASFRQLLDQCAAGELVTDVHLRLGDLFILQKQYAESVKSFESAIKLTQNGDDIAYALFRQGFALVQADQAVKAAEVYDQLAKKYPQSTYAASATLASAQSAYRGGNLEMASERFQEVLKQNNRPAATEAAHWLARIAIGKKDPASAVKLAKSQLDTGAEGDFAVALKLDYAEALSMSPQTLEASMTEFEKVYREHSADPLAPRALYNAAFSAMQANKYPQAIKLSDEFRGKFGDNQLLQDVLFVAAESELLTGNAAKASELYRELLSKAAKDNVQRPLWVLRAAASLLGTQKYPEAIKLINEESPSWKDKRNLAEAKFIAGQANMATRGFEQAAKDFDASYASDPSWQRAAEARLLAGQAKVSSGNRDAAVTQWKAIIEESSDSRMAAQARYKLAQLASNEGKFDRSIELYNEVLGANVDPGLKPYAQYGKAWSLIQLEKHGEAVEMLTALMTANANHPLINESRLARGVSQRHLEKFDPADADLTAFLESKPQGLNLGHALYELALVKQKKGQPDQATKLLERLSTEVPNYPAMAKVLYEWGWLLNESGNEAEAAKKFTTLVEKYPDDELVAEAAFFVGQKDYSENRWNDAIKNFKRAIDKSNDPALSEKAYYRLGWSHFKQDQYQESESAFNQQAEKHPQGSLALDALMMVGESRFKRSDFESALKAYATARERIQKANESAKTIRDPAERQVRELVLLHGGQSAAQLQRWADSLSWYEELRERFPATTYLAQVFYETGYNHQQLGDEEKALKFYSQVADNYRDEVAARARFMMGEIHFAEKRLDQAIADFQRVMYGFGADKAPDGIKNWQAKSGFEAGRCSDLLLQDAKSPAAIEKAKKFAVTFYQYVVEKHPNHELAAKSRERLKELESS